jgi:hypothetical protein
MTRVSTEQHSWEQHIPTQDSHQPLQLSPQTDTCTINQLLAPPAAAPCLWLLALPLPRAHPIQPPPTQP